LTPERWVGLKCVGTVLLSPFNALLSSTCLGGAFVEFQVCVVLPVVPWNVVFSLTFFLPDGNPNYYQRRQRHRTVPPVQFFFCRLSRKPFSRAPPFSFFRLEIYDLFLRIPPRLSSLGKSVAGDRRTILVTSSTISLKFPQPSP